MPVELTDTGSGNRLELHPWFSHNGNLKVVFSGHNSLVRIAQPPATCNGAVFQLGGDCKVEIGARCGMANMFIGGGNGIQVSVGELTFFTARPRFVMNEPSRVTIGRDCLIAADANFMTSDSHTLFEVASRRRLNPAADIVIEDHVWLGLQCLVLKGARIGHNTMVGLRSVVTRDLPPHCLAVGSPAKVIRTGVDWDRMLWAPDTDPADQSASLATPKIPRRPWWRIRR